jgi:hypothetical protein
MTFFGVAARLAPGTRVVDEVERVGGAGVLGQRSSSFRSSAASRVEDHVLEDGAEAARAGVDLRLGSGDSRITLA